MRRAPLPAPDRAPSDAALPLRGRQRSAPLQRPRLKPSPATVGGVAGPAAFVAAWAIGGAVTDGYSPVHDAISHLAELGAPTRPWMTAGMVAFGLGVPVFGLGLRKALDGPAWIAAVGAGLGSLAVAAVPLRPGPDVPGHNVAAVSAYLALVATPVLAAPKLRGWRRAASVAVGVAGAACLAATAADSYHGVFQRLGLTIVDVWIVATALSLDDA